MELWVATGVSGCGRIELLNELSSLLKARGKSVAVHDVGALIQAECRRNRLPYTDQRILDLDPALLRSLRSSALKSVRLAVLSGPATDFHLVGIHATFRWKHRIIPGIAYSDVLALNPSGMLNIVHDLAAVIEDNQQNPKWAAGQTPTPIETQAWMMEEELVTEVLADVIDRPMLIVSRRHHAENLADLFSTKKRRVYLSYPITAIRDENPSLLEQIQGPVLDALEKLFVVFDPLTVSDMKLVTAEPPAGGLSPRAIEIIKARTIERDFQFIEQSDAVVVVYQTDKVSPGVIAEMRHAHQSQKPVFVAFPGRPSPFLEYFATRIEPDVERLMPHLQHWADDSSAA